MYCHSVAPLHPPHTSAIIPFNCFDMPLPGIIHTFYKYVFQLKRKYY